MTTTNKQTNKQTNSVALSPRKNYTDWATATSQRNLVPTFVDRGVSRGKRGGSPTVVNLSFLDRSRYFFFQLAPHFSSQGLSGPRSRPTVTHKIWQRQESNSGPLDLQPGTLTTRVQRRSVYDHFLSNLIRFIIILSSHPSVLCRVSTDNAVKYAAEMKRQNRMKVDS
jgi:hypothetical protein